MYGSCATARDFEIHAPNATFEDPLMRAHGVKQIKSSFYLAAKGTDCSYSYLCSAKGSEY